MRKFIVSMLQCCLIYIFLYYVVLQFLYITKYAVIENYQDVEFTFDTSFYKLDENFKIVWILRILCILIFLYILAKDIGVSKRKSKYEQGNYVKLLTRFQRKRGSVRTQYDDNGNITRKTLECFYDEIMKPITKLQNKLCFHFHLPERKKWNTVLDIRDPEGHIRHIYLVSLLQPIVNIT